MWFIAIWFGFWTFRCVHRYSVAVSIWHSYTLVLLFQLYTKCKLIFMCSAFCYCFFAECESQSQIFCFFFHFEWLILFFDWNRFVLSVLLLLEHGHFSKDLFVSDGPSDWNTVFPQSNTAILNKLLHYYTPIDRERPRIKSRKIIQVSTVLRTYTFTHYHGPNRRLLKFITMLACA